MWITLPSPNIFDSYDAHKQQELSVDSIAHLKLERYYESKGADRIANSVDPDQTSL